MFDATAFTEQLTSCTFRPRRRRVLLIAFSVSEISDASNSAAFSIGGLGGAASPSILLSFLTGSIGDPLGCLIGNVLGDELG